MAPRFCPVDTLSDRQIQRIWLAPRCMQENSEMPMARRSCVLNAGLHCRDGMSTTNGTNEPICARPASRAFAGVGAD